MGKIIRCISSDGAVSLIISDSRDIVQKAHEIHNTTPVISAALGRLLTGAALMGVSLKGEKDSITLRLNGNGPAGTILAVSDSYGSVKGYAINCDVELPLNEIGKLDVRGAIGTDGFLTVIKDIGLKEPYVGQTPIVSGEIAEDLTHYFATSEQTGSVTALGVLVDTDHSIKAAGGFVISLLPGAYEDTIKAVEEDLKKLLPITTMLSSERDLYTIAKKILPSFTLEILDSFENFYECNCSKKRILKAFGKISKEEILAIADEDKGAEVVCHFCDKKYNFSEDELRNIGKN